MTATETQNQTNLPKDVKLRKAVLCFRAINHELRKRIFRFLQEGSKTVTEIYVNLNIKQSVASQHLAILRREGIVTTQRDGKFIYYSVDEERIKTVNKAVDLLAQ